MALQQIDLDTIQPNGKRGAPGRTSMTIVNQNAADTEQRLAALESGAPGVGARIDALEDAQEAFNGDVARLDDVQGSLAESQSGLSAAISAEVSHRQDADTALQKAIETLNARVVGDNLFVNGSLHIWQMGTSFINVGGYLADQWILNYVNCNVSTNRLTLNPAEIYGLRYCMRVAVTNFGAGGGGGANLRQPVEDVSTLAGKSAVVSFYARAGAAGMSMAVRGQQHFGTGGSAAVGLGGGGVIALSTAWTRHSVVVTVPSTSGKTAGSNHNLQVIFDFLGNGNYDLAGFCLKEGEVDTEPRWLGESAELIRCQYFLETSFELGVKPGTGMPGHNYQGTAYSAANVRVTEIPFKVRKRIRPSVSPYTDSVASTNAVGAFGLWNGNIYNVTSIIGTADQVTVHGWGGDMNFGSGLVAGNTYLVRGNWVADARY